MGSNPGNDVKTFASLCRKMLFPLVAVVAAELGAATLPSDFKELEYIESTGTQYIDTEYRPNSNSVATIDYQLMALPKAIGAHQAICGVCYYPSGAVTFKGYARKTDDQFVLCIAEKDAWNTNGRVASLMRSKLILDAQNKRAVTTDSVDGMGNYFSQPGVAPDHTGTYSCGLFCYSDRGKLGQEPARMKLYSAVFAENGVAIRNFVPCLNASGVAGVYDTVQSKFYQSLVGAFVAGPACAMATVDARAAKVSVTFPAVSTACELYLVGGSQDCAAMATSWPYAEKLVDVAANATACADVALPLNFAKAGYKYYRLQIRQGATVEATTMTDVAQWCDETGRRNVFADATALYVGAEDVNGNGLFDKGDWTDVRHAAESGSVTHQVERKYGEATNLVVRSIDVYSPTMEKTLANRSCLFMKQGMVTMSEAGGNVVRRIFPGSVDLKAPITGDTYTFLCRFRPGPEQTVRDTGDIWLASLGCQWGSTGVYLGFHGFANGGQPAVAYCPEIVNGNDTYRQATSLVISNMCWHEVAYVVKGPYARIELANGGIAAAQENPLFKVYENANAFPADKCISTAPWSGRLQCLGNGTASEMVSTNNVYMTKDFRGDIHMVAIWNRALSHEEIVEAFSDSQPSLWRVGVKGCSADTLAGSTATDVTASADDPNEWRKVPQKLVRGRRITLSFMVDGRQANLPQAVRLVPAAAVNATVSFSLDGLSLGSASLNGTAPALAFAPKRFLGAGHHALIIERTDEGADECVIDTLEMCGSWQIGKADNRAGEFGLYSPTESDRTVVSLAAKGYPGTTRPSNMITLRFFVPAELIHGVRYRYATCHPYYSRPDDPHAYLLNGVQVGTENAYGANNKAVIDLPESLIRAGENVLQIQMVDVSSTTSHWRQFDYHRIEIHPTTGLAIVFK